VDRREFIPIAALDAAPWNPKYAIEGEHLAALDASLAHFGVRDDLKVWPNPDVVGRYFVLDGNQRLARLNAGGAESIECRVLDDLDEDDAKLFTAAFDRPRASFDFRRLGELAASINGKSESLKSALLFLPAVNLPVAASSSFISNADPASLRQAVMPRVCEQASPSSLTNQEGRIPFIFSLTREGYAEVKDAILRTRKRLLLEARLQAALEGLANRDIDDLVVELALRVSVAITDESNEP
jgi:hypothetical protein